MTALRQSAIMELEKIPEDKFILCNSDYAGCKWII